MRLTYLKYLSMHTPAFTWSSFRRVGSILNTWPRSVWWWNWESFENYLRSGRLAVRMPSNQLFSDDSRKHPTPRNLRWTWDYFRPISAENIANSCRETNSSDHCRVGPIDVFDLQQRDREEDDDWTACQSDSLRTKHPGPSHWQTHGNPPQSLASPTPPGRILHQHHNNRRLHPRTTRRPPRRNTPRPSLAPRLNTDPIPPTPSNSRRCFQHP